MKRVSNTQAFNLTTAATLVSTSMLARAAIEVVNLGAGDVYLSYGIPPSPNNGTSTYSGILIKAGSSYSRDINVPNEAIYMLSTDGVNGSTVSVIETILLNESK